MKAYQPIDFSQLKTYSLHDRTSKVSVDDFAGTPASGMMVKDLLALLPNQLMGKDFPELVRRVIDSRLSDCPVIVGMGAHVIKVGLTPVLIKLMEEKIITGLAFNGACIVHDTETAIAGMTSEDVDEVLGTGDFGAAKETGEFINEAIINGARLNKGIGESVGDAIIASNFKYSELSLLAAARRLQIPVTVHVAVGTDIIHIHPSACGASIGKGSHIDFRLFCSMIADLEGGTYLNIGSAVLLPEIFLKALTAVRNLGHQVNKLTTANFDFIRQYRTMTNVVNRPTACGGKGFNITGHHELMIPLLACALLDELSLRTG